MNEISALPDKQNINGQSGIYEGNGKFLKLSLSVQVLIKYTYKHFFPLLNQGSRKREKFKLSQDFNS